MDGGGANLQAAGPGCGCICRGQPALLASRVYGSDWTVLEHQCCDDPVGNRRNLAGSEPRPQRGCPGVLAGYDAGGYSDRCLVETRYSNHLGGSLASHQTTVSLWFA